MNIRKSFIYRVLQKQKRLLVEYAIKSMINRRRKVLPKSVATGTSITDRSVHIAYLDICRLAVEYDDIFKIFKKSRDYRRVLEHVSRDQGKAYLDIIKKNGREILEYFPKFKENDMLGSPNVFNYEIGRFSPTTLRYIKVSVDLKNLFGDLNNLNIIEIGGGYGGQCKIISDIFTPQSYTIVDLAVVLPLIQKYLTKLNVKNVAFLTPQKIDNSKEYDLVVSNYAFSECIKSMQDDYIDKILFRSRKGYLTCNYDQSSSSNTPYNKKELVEILSAKYDLKIVDEEPKTGPDNFIITWNDG